jgi:hypothetical protein
VESKPAKRRPVARRPRLELPRGRDLLLVPLAAGAWLAFALLGLAVRLALFGKYRSQATTALLWGFGLGLYMWLGLLAVGVSQGRAIAFGAVGGAAIALFVFLRGSGLENPPAGQPRAVVERLRRHWQRLLASRS